MDTCILLLVKYPETGKVKVRLARHIDSDVILELYRNFVLDMISTIEHSCIPLILCVHPAEMMNRFPEWLGKQYDYIPQRGKDHSERVKNSLIDGFGKGYRNAMTLASDVPDLPERMLIEGCSSLRTHGSVIGPSPDGGYYLIGFQETCFVPRAFDGIRWSTDSTFSDTTNRLKEAGISIYLLPAWRDVDTVNDLKSLARNSDNPEFSSSRTMNHLLLHRAMLSEC
jgi:uncharacterized protein